MVLLLLLLFHNYRKNNNFFFFQSNIDEDPKMSASKDNNCKIVESVHRSILDELIDDAILDVCFEVHRSAKLSHLLIENPEKYVSLL